MPESSTDNATASTPIERARDEITAARQTVGAEERDLTWEDRRDVVIRLTKALRALDEIERTYVPKEGQS